MGEIENDYRFVFLTLTCRNVSGKDLSQQIDILVSAFQKLCKMKRFTAAVRGWCRCFEITHNWDRRDYHPHYHVILAVDKSYFTSDLYIKQNDWCLIWQSCMNVNYKPIVDVRVFKDSEKGKGKEVAEVAKYTIKASNIMANLSGVSEYNQEIQDEVKRFTDRITDDIVMTLDTALANRRLIGFGGIFKQKHKELNLDKNEDNDDLIRSGNDGTQNIMEYEIERYRWDIGHRNYVKIIEGSENYGGDNVDD
jgi:plasmid rolling circle replication initiator protein Rep